MSTENCIQVGMRLYYIRQPDGDFPQGPYYLTWENLCVLGDSNPRIEGVRWAPLIERESWSRNVSIQDLEIAIVIHQANRPCSLNFMPIEQARTKNHAPR